MGPALRYMAYVHVECAMYLAHEMMAGTPTFLKLLSWPINVSPLAVEKPMFASETLRNRYEAEVLFSKSQKELSEEKERGLPFV